MSEPITPSAEITCQPTGWYLWRRVIPMSILPLAMSAYFFYDWKVGYPAKFQQYEEYQAYKKAGKVEEWVKYAASKDWAKEPDEMDQRKIDEQYSWGMGVGILGVFCLVYYVLSYPKKLTANATSFTPPWGPTISFDSVQKIDRRPWKLKGIAKVYFKKGDSTKTAMIDDLRFKGADQVLKRLEENFHGEILDLAEDEPAETDPQTEPATGETP